MDSYVVKNMKLGYDILVPTKAKGTILVFIKKNEKNFIHEVLYVSHLNVNLISVGQLLQN